MRNFGQYISTPVHIFVPDCPAYIQLSTPAEVAGGHSDLGVNTHVFAYMQE